MSSEYVTKRMTQKRTSLHYTYSTVIRQKEKPVEVKISPISTDLDGLPIMGRAERKRTRLIYAVLYMEKEIQCSYTTGQNMIKQDVSSFIDSSLEAEAKRSGAFVVGASQPTYEMNIRLDSISCLGHYEYDYFALLIFRSHSEKLKYPVARLLCTLQLKKNGEVVFSKKITTEIAKVIKHVRHTSYLSSYPVDLVSGLSECIKEMNENIVRETNAYLATAPN
jgi:hypothetical protein